MDEKKKKKLVHQSGIIPLPDLVESLLSCLEALFSILNHWIRTVKFWFTSSGPDARKYNRDITQLIFMKNPLDFIHDF